MTPVFLRRMGVALMLGLAMAAAPARAYVLMAGPYWPDGTVTLQIELGALDRYANDTNADMNAEVALQLWNPFMTRLQLRSQRMDGHNGSHNDGVNDVFFSQEVYGYRFDESVLAVAIISSDSNRRTEADVIVNGMQPWDSYEGPLRAAKLDLQRVLVHEFGHVLGLGHTDPAQDPTPSIMNPYVGDIDEPTRDDQDGVGFLYGRGTGNPGVLPTLSPDTPGNWNVVENQWVQLLVDVTGGSRPMQFQWRKDGVAVPGATSKILEFAHIKREEAGRYTVVVTNEAGSATSREALVTVAAATRPSFTISDRVVQLYVGQTLDLWVPVEGDGPITYQWCKNGVDIPGARNERWTIAPLRAGDAGDYTVKARNIAGEAESPRIEVIARPVPPPQGVTASLSANVSTRVSRLSAFASSYPDFGPYRYQWYRDGLPIPGATSRDHEIPASAGPADYFAVISNAAGSTPSSAVSFVPLQPLPVTASLGWLETAQHGDIAYFLFADPARIDRYDLVRDVWLSPVFLRATPQAFAVGPSGIYVAMGKTVSRFALNGSAETPVLTADTLVDELLLAPEFLYVFAPVREPFLDQRFISVRLSDLRQVDSHSRYAGFSLQGSLAISHDGRKIFGRTDTNARDLSWLALGADGSLRAETLVIATRQYPTATRTFVTPADSLVIADGGTVFNATGLTYATTFGRSFDDLAMLADGSYATLSGSELLTYDARCTETGRRTLDIPATRLFVTGTTACCMAPPTEAGGAMPVRRIPLGQVARRPAPPKADASRAWYEPSQTMLGSDGIVYLLSRTMQNVFRWSATEGRHLEPFATRGTANFISHSGALGKLLVGYADGRITQIGPDGTETAVVNVENGLVDLMAAENYLLVRDRRQQITSYTIGGARVNTWLPDNGTLSNYTWDPAHLTLCYLQSWLETKLVAREVRADGNLGGVYSRSGGGEYVGPVRFSADGVSVGLGSGHFLSSDTLTLNFTLPYPVDDIAWLGAVPYTARDTPDGALVERWNGNQHARDASGVFRGRLVRLFNLPQNRLLLVAMRDNAPAFLVLDADLRSVAAPAPTITTQPASNAANAGGSIALNVAASGSGLSYQWARNGAAIPGADAATLTINTLSPDSAGIYSASVAGAATSANSGISILGLLTSARVLGGGGIVGENIRHPNGNSFDQVLVNNQAVSITARPGLVTRMSYIDLSDDIVQVEFSGAGTLSFVLDGATGPALPLNYHQNLAYMKGHAGIVIAGADETTNVSVFSVGRATAFDPTGAYDITKPSSGTNDPARNGSQLFLGHERTNYDGLADVAFIAILSRNGKFGGVRTANASYFAVKGITGLYAPGVQFTGPVFVGDINAFDGARPVLIAGSVAESRVTGGDLLQPNGRPVEVSGLTKLKFTDGSTAAGLLLPAQRNQARLEQDGADVTSQVVVNPTP